VLLRAAGAVATRIDRAIALFGRDRLLLHPDCGFATLARQSPTASAAVAEAKLRVIAQAAGPMSGPNGAHAVGGGAAKGSLPPAGAFSAQRTIFTDALSNSWPEPASKRLPAPLLSHRPDCPVVGYSRRI
jgi:hypothetical protein